MSSEHRQHNPREAREQAAEALSFIASEEIVINGEVFEVPNRGLFDDDQRDRINQLEFESESWDRDDDGQLKRPYRVKGKLVRPPYEVQYVTALFGPDKYKRFKAGGGRATDVMALLAYMDRRVVERAASDPKSVDSGADLGGASDGD